MSFIGAFVNHRGHQFGVIRVKPSVLRNPGQVANLQSFGTRCWGNIPIVLADTGGQIKGPPNTVRFLKSVAEHQSPWRKWSVR